MAVPAHDERDFDFAKEYGLDIKPVIKPQNAQEVASKAYTQDGILFNSQQFDGLSSRDAIDAVTQYFQTKGIGKKVINFRLKDWGISRQRYWGAPIPLIHCENCGIVTEKKENLPIVLPEDVDLSAEGNPIANHPTWKNCICPKCGGKAVRETDTMDTFVESSWYFLRYTASKSIQMQKPFDAKEVAYWMDVDHYIGGIEHAILHLLYARFFTKVNIVDPDALIKQYGADTARLFILFAAPPTQELEWNDSAVEGAFRFLKKFYDKSSSYGGFKCT